MYRYTLVLVCLVLFSWACSKTESAPKAGAGPRPATPVKAVSAVLQDVPLEIRSIGNVEAYSSVAVKSRVPGQLIRVHVRDGQDVRKDQLLFEIDPLPFEQQVRQAEANVARDRALEKQAEASIARSRAQEKQARSQAARYATLFKEGITSREQAEQFRVAAEAAEAGLNAELSALESARASLRANEARLSEARLHLSYTRIASPISGRAGAVVLKEGNLVKENDTTPLVNILQVVPVYVSFAVPERSLDAVRREMRTRKLPVTASAEGGGESTSGALDFIDNTVDTTTGTIRVKAMFPNRNVTLWPGQFVNATLTLGTERNAIVVPGEAVQNRQEGQYVWVVKSDNTAELRPVKIGRMQGGMAVVASGIEPGENVVTEGQLRVTPGATLRVTKAQTMADLTRRAP